MKKVLHIRSSGDFLGAERVILECCKHSNENGYIPVIGCLKYTKDKDPILIKFADEIGIETVLFVEKNKIDFTCAKEIKTYIKNNKIDILHCHGYKENIYGVLSHAGIPKISTNHLWKKEFIRGKLNALIDSIFLRFFDIIVGVSERIILEMKYLGINRAISIANGVDIRECIKTERSTYFDNKFGLTNNNITICIIASLTPVKGHSVLIQAFKEINIRIPESRLLIVGDGICKEDLIKQVKDNNLENSVIFAGRQNDIVGILSICDIFVLPSFDEGLPMSLLEAMACEKAVVATTVGENVNIIQNYINGILVEPGNILQIQDVLLKLCENKEMRNGLANKSRSIVKEKYSSSIMTKKYCGLYDSILNN